MRKYEPKDFGLLDWVHYLWDLLVVALLWAPTVSFWAMADGWSNLLAFVSAVIVLAIADKLAHYFVLPFLAKFIK